MHHLSVISTVGTLLLKSSSQLISTREIAQLLQKCNFPGSLNYVDPYNSIRSGTPGPSLLMATVAVYI